MNSDKDNEKEVLLQQEFPEIQGDPKINIQHPDATMDAHDAIKGEMLDDQKDQSGTLLG